jgi:hypothetical protein
MILIKLALTHELRPTFCNVIIQYFNDFWCRPHVALFDYEAFLYKKLRYRNV